MKAFPPGPRGGVLGLGLVNRMRTDPLGFLVEMGHRHGDLSYARLGPLRFFLVNHPDLIRDVLVTQAKHFTKSRRQMRILAQVDGEGLVVSDGDLWLRQRRLVQTAFRSIRLAGYASTMSDLTARHIETWGKEKELDLAVEMTELTLKIIGRTMFGIDMGPEAAEIREAVHVLSATLVREFGNAVTLPDWLPLPAKRRKRWALGTMKGLIDGIVRQRRAAGGKGDDLLSLLVVARDEEGDGRGMSDELVRDEAMTMFNAGHDTTAAGLAWVWYLIGTHPQVERRLVEEACAVLGEREGTHEDASKLVYTEMVLKETLRLYPPAFALFAREALVDTSVGGYAVPKGAWCYMSTYVTQHDARFWPDPERFDPERFAPGRKIEPFAWFPFGGGPHVCIGQHFAMLEMKLILAAILRRYRIAVAAREVEREVLFSLRPKAGMPARVELR